MKAGEQMQVADEKCRKTCACELQLVLGLIGLDDRVAHVF